MYVRMHVCIYKCVSVSVNISTEPVYSESKDVTLIARCGLPVPVGAGRVHRPISAYMFTLLGY